MKNIGSRAEVMHGKAKKTSGGLTKKDLKYNKYGKIISKKMSQIAKNEKRLEKAGYYTKKGVFGIFRKSMKGGNDIIECKICQDLTEKYEYCCSGSDHIKICIDCFTLMLSILSEKYFFENSICLSDHIYKKRIPKQKYIDYGISPPEDFTPTEINSNIIFVEVPIFISKGTFGIVYLVNILYKDGENTNNYKKKKCIVKILNAHENGKIEFNKHKYLYDNIPDYIPEPLFYVTLHIGDNSIYKKLFPHFEIGNIIHLYFMEFINGITLRKKCDGTNFCSINKAKICNIIKKMNKLGLHCDLHGNNLIVLPNGNIKIIDFGTYKMENPNAIIENIVDPNIKCSE